MFEVNNNHFCELASEVKDYAGLKAEELKDKAGKKLSVALSGMLSWFLIIVVLAIALALLAYALLQWLNTLLGAPWGTLLVFGLFLLALIVLIALRNKLFVNTFSNILTGMAADELDARLNLIDEDVRKQEKRLDKGYKKLRNDLTPSNIIMGIFKSGVGKAGWMGILLSLLTKRRKK